MEPTEELSDVILMGAVEDAVVITKPLKNYERQHKIEVVEGNINRYASDKQLSAEPYIRYFHKLLEGIDET